MKTDHLSRKAVIQFFNKWIDDLNKQIDDSVAYPHLRSDYKVCKTQLLDCIHAIEEMPASDAVEVVRCSVCKKVVLENLGNRTAYWCPVNQNYRCWDEFCNRGERLGF